MNINQRDVSIVIVFINNFIETNRGKYVHENSWDMFAEKVIGILQI